MEDGVPLPQKRLARQPTSYLPIDQPRHGARPSSVIATMMTISVTYAFIAAHPSNRVFYLDPPF